MTKTRLILILVIIVGGWYFWGKDWMAKRSQPAQVPAGQELQSGEEVKARPSLSSDDGNLGAGLARVHYLTKEALASCSAETSALEQAVDPKYGHPAAGALVVMTLPLPTEQTGQYASVLAPGTRLLTMQIDKEGVVTANYNSALNADAVPCVKSQRRAQIEQTLKEFPEIKNVVITVQGEKWE